MVLANLSILNKSIFQIIPHNLPSLFWGFLLNKARSNNCASWLKNCGIPSFALKMKVKSRISQTMWQTMSWILLSYLSLTHGFTTDVSRLSFNLFQPSVAFHIETSHLFCRVKKMTGFYIKRNAGLKWVKQIGKQL